MDDLGVIDQFVATFSAYIDSGFGLLGPDIAYLTTFLVTVDIVLAGLFWAMGPDNNIIASFVKKVLYIGVFALILNQFSFLANILFDSFASLGITASGASMTADDLMRPGFVANTGFTAGYPLLDAISELTGPIGFFTNIVLIIVFFLAWLITLFAFFFLAIQLFVTVIEFKLTTLAGFVLVPFALWNKTSFLAERVLGNVIASGIKLMVLAIIVGIGSTLFASVTASFTGDVGLEEAGAVILASLALFALGIFGPGIATGLVSGAPQLGAGAAVGTAAAVGAGTMAAGAVATGGASAVAGGAMAATKAGASMAGGTRMAYAMGKTASGARGIKGAAAGASAVAQAGAGSIASRAKSAASRFTSPINENFQSGGRGAVTATGGTIKGGMSAANDATPIPAGQEPDWARQARRGQNRRDASMATMHAVRSGDGGGAGQGPQLKQDEE